MAWTAVYDCGQTQGIALAVISSNFGTSGEITGYYVALYQGGSLVSSGFTPTTFTLTPGQTYTIQACSFGSCTFYYWINVPGQGESTVFEPCHIHRAGIQHRHRCYVSVHLIIAR
jgi:hypothetical protein